MKDFIRSILSLVFVTSLLSCTSFIKGLSEESLPIKPLESKAGYCPLDKSPEVLLGRDKIGVKIFQAFLKAVPNLNATEKMVAYSLFQMNMRPDLATPSSRFQILTSTSKGIQYWDFKDSALDMDIPKSSPPMAFLLGLETVLKTYSSRKSLSSIAKLLDENLPSKILISSDFADFIDQNKEALLNVKPFDKTFFKAGEQLRYGESIPKLPYAKIINQYYKFKGRLSVEVTTSNQLYSYTLPKAKSQEFLCNVDLQKYAESKYKISSDSRERHHPFAIKYPNGQFFLGITSISGRNYRPLLGTFLIETTQDNISVPLCYRNAKNGISAYLSFKGRDPGQYLYNLFQYNIHQSTSPIELDQYLKYPRHLILKNPLRIFYESNRAKPKDLSKFLKQDVPVYHSTNLGEVWLYSPESGFVIDDRGKAHLSCMK